MTNRLSFWIVASVVFVGACALFLFGFSGLGLTSLLMLLPHVPAVCAVLLTTRALVLAVCGRPWGLEFRGRTYGNGPSGLVVPALFLLLWTVARENGFVKAHISVKNMQHNSSSFATGWEDRVPEHAISTPGLAVTAPAGILGDTFRQALRHHWSDGDGSQLHGAVRLVHEPPFAGWPLYKSVDVQCQVEADLQMRRPSEEIARCTTLTMKIGGTWTAIGTFSRRDFHEWLGSELGRMVRDEIGNRVRKLRDPK